MSKSSNRIGLQSDMGRLTLVSTLDQFPTYQARFALSFPIQCPSAVVCTLDRPQLYFDSCLLTVHSHTHLFVKNFPITISDYHVHSCSRKVPRLWLHLPYPLGGSLRILWNASS